MKYQGNTFSRVASPIASTVLISLLVLSVIVGLGLRCSANYTGANKQVAEDEARQYANDLQLNVKGVSCSPRDSDGDGYVGCSIMVEGSAEPISAECMVAYSFGDGCRPWKPFGNKTR